MIKITRMRILVEIINKRMKLSHLRLSDSVRKAEDEINQTLVIRIRRMRILVEIINS